jgi:hypothetical protein
MNNSKKEVKGLMGDYEVYNNLKQTAYAILKRRRQLYMWEKIMDDESFVDTNVVNYWRSINSKLMNVDSAPII